MSNTQVVSQSQSASSSNLIIAGDYDITISKDLQVRWHNVGAFKMNILALASMMTELLSNKEKMAALSSVATGLLSLPKNENISLGEGDMYHCLVHIEFYSDLTFEVTGASKGNLDVVSMAKFLAQLGKEIQTTLYA